MRRVPLLCELHAHTTWSDGALRIGAIVDLYGRAGFDVLAVTDHVVRGTATAARAVDGTRHAAYLAELHYEAERARALYDLLVVPGLELTWDDPEPTRAAHALAIGLREFVPVDRGLDEALEAARAAGAALIAAHPYPPGEAARAQRTTARFAHEPEWAARAVDRFELVNRRNVFGWVAAARLPVVATGDFHRPEHLTTWKTLLPCEKREEAVVDYLRSGQPVSLTELPPAALAA
jgi:3',5'-nucleoside bisphosphate phosphatase